MAKKQKKKKGKKPPLSSDRPLDAGYWQRYNERKVDPKLIKYFEGLDWMPKRCFLAWDFEHDMICVIIPELMMEGEMYRYFEFPMLLSGERLVDCKEIDEILKKAKRAGRRRRLL